VFSALAALVGFYLAVALVALPLVAAIPDGWKAGPLGIVAQSLPVLAAGMLVNVLLVRRRLASWEMLGWHGRSRDLKAFGFGMGVGVTMAVGALLVAILAGGAGLELSGESLTAYLPAAARLGIGLAVAALAEEVLFRGYPLARLAQPMGRVGASVVLAGLFAAVHLGNPEVSPLGLANIGLASLVLSAAFFTPGGLAAAWGLHLGWNAGLGLGADAPVSGIALELPTLEFRTGGPSWVTGGAFGPEGGLAATVMMGLALIWLSRRVARAGKGEST
jgi:membrane protease YdiL (CAAX protease family)